MASSICRISICFGRVIILSAAIFIGIVVSSETAAAASCESLASISLPHVTITAAQTMAPGAFTPPSPAGGGAAPGRGPQFGDLAAFCRVMATAKPSSDSEIKIEVWMPAMGWNGEFRATGFPGSLGGAGIGYAALANGLRDHYAAGGSNTGHDGDVNMMNHPEKITDWAYRSLHEVAVTSKAMIKAFYGNDPKRSVISDCGAVTIPALNDPPRNPDDFDAIAVGGYAADFTHHIFSQMLAWVVAGKDQPGYIPPDKFKVLHTAVLDACDANDGAKDGLIENPPACKFDPAVIQCKGADGPNCLTQPQVDAVRGMYQGPIDPRTKKLIYSPYFPGSELTWGQNTGAVPFFLAGPEGFRVEAYDGFRYLAFKDPNWTYKSRPVNFDSDVAVASARDNLVIDAPQNVDLRKFVDRGGKLLLDGGWSNTGVPGAGEVDYYKSLVAKLGTKRAQNSVRLFMIPGMGNCPGTNGDENMNFDRLPVLERWMDTGKAPDQLIVTRYKAGAEAGKHLVCAYPQVATYKGGGSTDDPANFACRLP
jgi:feruloyl esterase